MWIAKRQIKLYMEIFLNTKYQGLPDLVNLPSLHYPREPFFHLDFQNRLLQTNSIQIKKVGFVPFKIPDQKKTLTGESAIEDIQSGDFGDSLNMSSDDLSESIGKPAKNKKGPYRKYTLDEKMKAVEILNSGKDLKTVAKQFNIPRRNLLRWRKNGCQRKEGGGRPTDSSMEDAVCQMLREGKVQTEKQIRQLAKKLSSLKNFKASKGWFVKFCRRYEIDPHNIRTIEKQNL